MCHRIDAVEHAPADKHAAGDTQDHDDCERPASGVGDDVEQPLAFFEIAADQKMESARELQHAHQGAMFGGFRLLEAAVDGLHPTRLVEHAGRERADVAGQSLPARCGHEVKARPRPARSRFDHEHQPPNSALVVLLRQAGDLGVDRAGDFLGDEAARVEREIAEQERREQGEHQQIDERQSKRRRAKQLSERRHGSWPLSSWFY